jgi:hypothetical protein
MASTKTKSATKRKVTAKRTRKAKPPTVEQLNQPADASSENAVPLAEGQKTTPGKKLSKPHKLRIVVGGNPGTVPAEDQTAYEGEDMPALTGETWVVLGEHESVPERYQGSIAAVIDPIPIARKEDPVTGAVKEYTHPDAELHVRERSQGAELWIPLDAVKQISLNGRPGVTKGL